MEWINRTDAAEAIRKLNEDDLRFLNRLIVERLKLIIQARSTVMLAHFSVGDRVIFPAATGDWKAGVIIRLNKKTASNGICKECRICRRRSRWLCRTTQPWRFGMKSDSFRKSGRC